MQILFCEIYVIVIQSKLLQKLNETIIQLILSINKKRDIKIEMI